MTDRVGLSDRLPTSLDPARVRSEHLPLAPMTRHTHHTTPTAPAYHHTTTRGLVAYLALPALVAFGLAATFAPLVFTAGVFGLTAGALGALFVPRLLRGTDDDNRPRVGVLR